MQRPLPLGVGLISALLVLGGILLVLEGLGLSIVIVPSSYVAIFGTFNIPFLLGVFDIILGWGLWNLRSWAFWLFIIAHGISLLIQLPQLGAMRAQPFSINAIGLVLRAVMLAYMWSKKEYFS
jgi:hypothetical protein